MLHNVIDVSFTDLIPASQLLGAGVFFVLRCNNVGVSSLYLYLNGITTSFYSL